MGHSQIDVLSGKMATPINKKKKFVKDGVFRAELNRFLTNELAEDGYSGVQVRHTPARTEIIILATRTQNVLGEKGRRIRELTSLVQKRFNFAEGSVELYAEKVALRGQRAKSMKFTDGLMIHSGEPRRHYVDTAVRHVHLRQGVLGIKVKIMLPWDPSGKNGPRTPLPDHINIVEPKDEVIPSEPHSENKMEKAAKKKTVPPAQTPEL